MAKSKDEYINIVKGFISLVAGLLTAMGQLTDSLKSLHGTLASAPPLVIYLVSGVVLCIGAFFLRRGLSRKSRLLRPEVLDINPDNPEHLKGRGEDIRRLEELVAHHALVFLEGESGSGKSALIRSGLLPALTGNSRDSTLLPIYINAYGSDWVDGPVTPLIDALWRTLCTDQRCQLEIATKDDIRHALLCVTSSEEGAGENNQTPKDKPASLWVRINNHLGQTPLLIFDQFDDYQTQHRHRFLRQGKWLTMRQLAINKSTCHPFWVAVRQAVTGGHIHCLFVTGSDTFSGLEAVRFVEPEVSYLERLEPAFIIALLEQLVTPEANGSPIIAHPEAGWTRLKERLVNDLAYQDRILPIQARTALKGLIKLPYLSVGAYERAGRVSGLEASYIEDSVKSAAYRSGIDQSTVMQVLLQLIDQSDPHIPKTKSASLSTLRELVQTSAASFQRMLAQLRQNGIIRSRIEDFDDYQNNDPQWSLYHDYLAGAVISAYRKINHWQQFLDEHQKAFQQAMSVQTRWRTLLSPWQLSQLLLARVLRKFSFSGHHRYLACSTLRFLPVLIMLLFMLVVGKRAIDWQTHQHAKRTLSAIMVAHRGDSPQDVGLHHLWELAEGSPRLKEAFIKEAIRELASHKGIFQRRYYIAQAVWGIDPHTHKRSAVLEEVLTASQNAIARNNESNIWYALWAFDIFNSAPERFSAKANDIVISIVAAMEKTTDGQQLGSLRGALELLGEKLPVAQVEAVAKMIMAVMEKITDGRQLEGFGQVLGSLGEKLPAAQAEVVVKMIVTAMEKTTDAWPGVST